jgi:DNA recombination protein RmuC
LGRSLERAVEDYNALVGTLERRVLVTARRLHELDLTASELAEPTPLTLTRRPVTSPELLDVAPLDGSVGRQGAAG